MKKGDWKFRLELLLAVLLVLANLAVLMFLYLLKTKDNQTYYEENTVIVKETFDEFADEIIELVKRYDQKVDEKMSQEPYGSRRLIVQGNERTRLDLVSYGADVAVQGPDDLYVLQFSDKEKAEEAHVLLQKEDIEYCEPDIYAKAAEEAAAYKPMSWGAEEMNAHQYAKKVRENTGEHMTVAVIDTGVYHHSFLAGRILEGGRDFIDGDYEAEDEKGHGTHVAGTIVDCTPGLNVKILPVRVLDRSGRGSALIINLGVRYAVQEGAQVLNLSLGGATNRTMDNAVFYAVNRGCTVVVAAGNEEQNTQEVSPAHLEECIVVSAIDGQKGKADFSNWGESVDFAAPGVGIVSCVPRLIWGLPFGETKSSYNGTSMATPHISAFAAMIKLEFPQLSPSEVYEKLKGMCVDLGDPGEDEYYGWGMPQFHETKEEELPELLETEPETEKKEETEQSNPMDGYGEVLEEYRWLAENHFAYYELQQDIRYANEGTANFGGKTAYCVYYRLEDLAGDGESELLISVNEKGKAFNIVDIFGKDHGKPVALIESNEAVGYRSTYYITTDHRVKNYSSGGALNTWTTYYTLPENSVVLVKDAEYAYDGWNGDQCTYTDSAGKSTAISKERYDAVSSDADVETESEWILLYGPGGEEVGVIPEPQPEQEKNFVPASSIYQGIFMKDEVFLELVLYSSPVESVGEIREVGRPGWNEEGYIEAEHKNTVGEIYDLGSEGGYGVRGADGIYMLRWFEGEIQLTGDEFYEGIYTQVSNRGGNIRPSELWLDIPEAPENGDDGQENAAAIPDPVKMDTGNNPSEYILPQSDTTVLTERDLMFLSEEELRIARNEIFARHGRKFDDPELRAHFENTDWYNGRYTPEEFEKIQHDVLSEAEWKNIQLISEAEKRYN